MPESGGEPVTVLLTAPFHVLHGHHESTPCRPDCPPRPAPPGRPPAVDHAPADTDTGPGETPAADQAADGAQTRAADGQAPHDPYNCADLDGDCADLDGDCAGEPCCHGPVEDRPDDRVAGASAAHLEDGTPVSPETARRMSCDAWLVAAIIATTGEILDIGRLSRTVPRPIRRALIARDGGCAFLGCGRPPRWCHAHHIWHWSKGGPTALHNLVLLCGAHHRLIHHHGWEVWLDPDTGLPRFRAPRWIDPDQTTRPPWRPPVLRDQPLRR